MPSQHQQEQQITLYSLEDSFVLESNTKYLSVNKSTKAISTEAKVSLANDQGRRVYGLLGSIQLHNQYLAVITEVEKIGTLYHSHEVYRILNVDWLPYNTSAEAHEDDEQYLELLQSVVDAKSFYFSYTLDLTLSVKQSFKNASTDAHFFWNGYLMKDFLTAGANDWIIPVIRGFVAISNISLKSGKAFKFALISRLGTKRVGTRYLTRGLDKNGNAANYAETEQIVETDQELLSFVQIRGSIPLRWKQTPNLKYNPKISISDSANAYETHISEQLQRYNKLFLLNLVKGTGREKAIADAFQTAHTQSKKDTVNYTHFDFAARFKFTAVQKSIIELTKEVEKHIEEFGYHIFDYTRKAFKKEQAGVFRVNCIDCLDRTNVTESVIALTVLERQLKEVGLIGSTESIKDYPAFESAFKCVWADNGDALSNMYAGTGALKADITRTGKRSLTGLYNDGTNSLNRYYLNNFRDGTKRDAIYLFLGKYIVNPESESPFKAAKASVPAWIRSITLLYVLYVIVFLIVTFFLHLVVRRSATSLVNNPLFKKTKKTNAELLKQKKKKSTKVN